MIQPRESVAPTPTKIAIGAARAAPAVSSAIWAAESYPVKVHIGAVNASRNAHPLFDRPVLFSYIMKASLVDTLLSPEHTSNAMIAATLVPTRGAPHTRINALAGQETYHSPLTMT